ncbi:putative adenylyltransferase/sulfurtransferase MoeZ [Prochlorococcus marinus str. MIT 1323]|nr:putative adenylyltransferase/sulfurtransferase MoeZ [Prochlorococcus marinus str. MIT 1323]
MTPSCAEDGVIVVLPGIIGVIQATEVIKIITGIGNPLNGGLLLFHAFEMKFDELQLLNHITIRQKSQSFFTTAYFVAIIVH